MVLITIKIIKNIFIQDSYQKHYPLFLNNSNMKSALLICSLVRLIQPEAIS
jgi:hypothetical protein